MPKGAVTDFCKATQAKEDETIVFSWVEYPDKATRDAANQQMSEGGMEIEMPFDGQRLIWGGFEVILSE